MELTLKFDQRKKEVKALIEYLKSLPYIEVETQTDLGKPNHEKLNVNEQKDLKNLRNVAVDVKKNVGKNNIKH